jgi:hypothetical protein
MVEPASVVPPRRIRRGACPRAAHGPQSIQRGCFAQALFQPGIGVPWITHRPPSAIAEVRKRVAKLVRKLKSILGPAGISGRQAYRDAAVCLALEVGHRMTRSMVDVDARNLSAWAISPDLVRRRLQDCRDILGTNPPEPRHVNMDSGNSRPEAIFRPVCGCANCNRKKSEENNPR